MPPRIRDPIQPRERRQRQQSGDQKEQQPKEPGSGGGSGQQKTQPANPKEPKNSGGQIPDPHSKNATPTKPILPLEADVVKQVWGHLPDKLRQQATQYYQEEFMPRYAELLKQYYSSLSEKK